ncbi:MAG: imidazole glycerol phosphate synthase subunit HisH [Nanoarchaeota archaeon]
MIAIIDYGAGNLQSVKNALDFIRVKNIITDDAAEIEKADKLIFPGVGSFGDVMNALNNKRLIDVLLNALEKNKPYLGICLGMQVLFDGSDEDPATSGLGIFSGKVRKFKSKTLKIPQIGWNSVSFKANPLFSSIPDETYFYFVHSYYAEPKNKSIVLGKTDYCCDFVSAVSKNNIFGVQFHPERSGDAGLQMLKNFSEL